MAKAAEWAAEMGQNWAARHLAMERQLAPLTEAGLGALSPAGGERIVDVGCGSGPTTRAIAGAVGAEGQVLGVDISPDLIAVARSKSDDLPQLRYVQADAQHYAFPTAGFDAVFSRLGVMFFDDPGQALRNIRRTVRPGGRAVFVVFRAQAENPWAKLPGEALAEVLGPTEPLRVGAPGPFGWAEPDHVRPILDGAGFTGVHFEPGEAEMEVGMVGEGWDTATPVERAAGLMTRIGPVARRLAAEATPDEREAVVRAITERLARHVDRGAVRLWGRYWIVTADVPEAA